MTARRRRATLMDGRGRRWDGTGGGLDLGGDRGHSVWEKRRRRSVWEAYGTGVGRGEKKNRVGPMHGAHDW